MPRGVARKAHRALAVAWLAWNLVTVAANKLGRVAETGATASLEGSHEPLPLRGSSRPMEGPWQASGIAHDSGRVKKKGVANAHRLDLLPTEAPHSPSNKQSVLKVSLAEGSTTLRGSQQPRPKPDAASAGVPPATAQHLSVKERSRGSGPSPPHSETIWHTAEVLVAARSEATHEIRKIDTRSLARVSDPSGGCIRKPNGTKCIGCRRGYYPRQGRCAECPASSAAEVALVPVGLYAALGVGTVASFVALFGFLQCAAPPKYRKEAIQKSVEADKIEAGQAQQEASVSADGEVRSRLARNGGRIPILACDLGSLHRAAKSAGQLALWAVLSMQTLAQVSKSTTSGVPGYVRDGFASLSVFELAPTVGLHPKCMGTAPLAVETVLLTVQLTVVLLLGVVGAFVLRRRGKSLALSLVTPLFVVATLLYAVSNSTAVAVLNCRKGPDGVSRMVSNDAIECHGQAYDTAVGLSWSVIAVSTVGLVVGTVLFMLVRMQRLLEQALGAKPEEDSDDQGGGCEEDASDDEQPTTSGPVGPIGEGRRGSRLARPRTNTMPELPRHEMTFAAAGADGDSKAVPVRAPGEPGRAGAAAKPTHTARPAAQCSPGSRRGSKLWDRTAAERIVMTGGTTSGPQVERSHCDKVREHIQLRGRQMPLDLLAETSASRRMHLQRTKANRRVEPGTEVLRDQLIDSSQSIRTDPAMTPCVAREYLPSRWWHVPLTLVQLAVLGTLTQLLLVPQGQSLAALLSGCMLITIMCTSVALLTVLSSPYDRGHSVKRWLRAGILTVTICTSWLQFFTALQGESAEGEGNPALAAMAVIILVLGLIILGILFVMVIEAVARNTAVALFLGEILRPIRGRCRCRCKLPQIQTAAQRQASARSTLTGGGTRRSSKRTSPPQMLRSLELQAKPEPARGAHSINPLTPVDGVAGALPGPGGVSVANPLHAGRLDPFARRHTSPHQPHDRASRT